jgi:hypothetical protein
MKQPRPARNSAEHVSAPSKDVAKLPPRVAAMREQILQAAGSGDIESLRPAIERSETIPIFGRGGEQPKRFADAIDVLKRRSFDGKGREVLAILQALFDQPYVVVTQGGSTTYVWPAFVHERKLPDDADARLALMKCLRFTTFTTQADPLERIDRLGIGADGTWHYFWQG